MSGSSVVADTPAMTTFEERRLGSNNNRRRRGKHSAQISSQDVRYNRTTSEQHQQQQEPQQSQRRQRHPQGRYRRDQNNRVPTHFSTAPTTHYEYDEQYRRSSQFQPRQFQMRPNTASSQFNTRFNERSAAKSSSARSTNETENLRSLLTENLLRGNYECIICIVKIQRNQAIWSCEICYKMFHLDCMKKWADSEGSGTHGNWRCPGCQYSYSSKPAYTCFCKKRENPVFQPGDIPHSCGERCEKLLNKKSNDCQHRCSELCHPGPCPTCTTMIKRRCLCGRESQLVMCSSEKAIKCENPCGKLQSCQHHKCDLVCHPRECAPCDKKITQFCSSHKTMREVLCTADTGGKNTYKCGEQCGKLLSCGTHICVRMCHDGPCSKCSLLPEICDRCACGKTKKDNTERTSCSDPLPTCEKICGKALQCGSTDNHHLCLEKCHNGPCAPCDKETTLQCRCGQLSKAVPCSQAVEYDPLKNPYRCEQRCNRKKMCGKHRCSELCCNHDVHVCELICGKMLSCGIHKCESLCHKGDCRKCSIVSYEELPCRCGQTILHPPVVCGTAPPSCNYKCDRTHACDHPVYHNCHNDAECPPCAYLVSKMCVGGHAIRDNIPCYLKEVLCGQPCGKPLSCGVHVCQRSCHGGPCQTPNQKCLQRCEIKREECGHSCNALCHGHDPCPMTTCRETIKARCPCNRLEKDIICDAKPTEKSERSEDLQLAQSLTEALSVRTIDLSLAKKQQTPQYQLECDDECRIIQRNKALAQALSINLDEPRFTTIVYTDFLKDYAKRNIEFVQCIERDLMHLVEETKQYRNIERCHTFKPMKKNERHVVHELASYYGLQTQSVDPEPYRNVVAYAVSGECKIPNVLLSEMVRREKSKIPPPVITI